MKDERRQASKEGTGQFAADLQRNLEQFPADHAGQIAGAYVFGSSAAGTSGPLSDYDIALLFQPSVTPQQRLEIASNLIGNLQRIDGPLMDVTILNEAPPEICHAVIRDGRAIFVADEKQRIAFEERVMREYLDFRWVLDQYDQALLQRAREGKFADR